MHESGMRRLVAGAALIGAIVLLGVAMPVVASPASAKPVPAGTPATSSWAWVVVRRAHVDHTPTALNQGTSTVTGVNSVVHAATGIYQVTLGGLGGAAGEGGAVLVTPLGTSFKVCVTAFWSPVGDDQLVEVHCYARNGAHADSKFIVDYVKSFHGAGEQPDEYFAYIYEIFPTGGADFDPNYEYGSMGGAAIGDRVGNRHRMNLFHLGSNRGHVQVTATAVTEGASPTAYTPAVCSVGEWHDLQNGDPSDLLVTTRCRDLQGDPLTDRMFELLFTQDDGIQGVEGNVGAYVLADRPTTASYVPTARYTFLQYGGTARISRQGVGQYTVKLPHMPGGGSVQVTPYGQAARHCVVADLPLEGMPQRIGVRCFDFDGNLRDAAFTLAFAY